MTRRGLFIAPFDALADPRMIGDVAARAEAAGWDGLFLWDHLRYGERVEAIADVWTCCAAVALRSRLVTGPMITPLPRRRPQVVAKQAASLALLSEGRFVLGLGLGDDTLGELSSYGDETDARTRGAMLDDGLAVVSGLLSGEPVDHEGPHYRAADSRFLPAPRVPIWLGGRGRNPRPLRRAATQDGYFVIGMKEPGDLSDVGGDLAEAGVADGFDLVVQVAPGEDATPWAEAGATWVLTTVGPYDLDVDATMAIAEAGPDAVGEVTGTRF